MSHRITPAALAGLLLLAACGERDPAAPATPAPGAAPAVRADLTVTDETRQLEGLARRLAIALGDPSFRARFHARLEASPYREGKLHLQRTLLADGRAELSALARLNGERESLSDSVQRATRALEVYLPVPGHRRQWRGDTRLLVATAARDGDIPVAFDLNGGRHYLDPTRPPQTPVLAVVPVETDFDAPGVGGNAVCTPPECTSGGGGPPPPPPNLVSPGLYMTKASFVQDFESWLKGSPEFEVQVLGRKGVTDSLSKYQCAGEHQPAPYRWDGGTSWTGSVLLFSQAQISAYHASNPAETFRIVAMEDDDTACEMKIDEDRWARFVGTIGPLYQDFTGAIDSGTVKKYVLAGRSLRDFLAAAAGVIKTNDDLIGNAMEDRVVGEYHTNFNWILRADDNVTNGWIKLEMK